MTVGLNDHIPQPWPALSTHASHEILPPSACICHSWCRSDLGGQMIDGRRFPAPDHADGCPAQVREPFTVLDYEGATVTMEPREAEQMVSDGMAEGISYIERTVYLTRDQFERMDEFTGF